MDDITRNSSSGDDNQVNSQVNTNDVQIPGPVGEEVSDTQNVPVSNNQSDNPIQTQLTDSSQSVFAPTPPDNSSQNEATPTPPNNSSQNEATPTPPNNSSQNEATPTPSAEPSIDDLRSKINSLSDSPLTNSNIDFGDKKEEVGVDDEVAPEPTPSATELEPTTTPAPSPVTPSAPGEATEGQGVLKQEILNSKSSNMVKKEIFTDESEYKDLINNDILDLIGLKDLPETEKNELYKKVLETVEDRSMVRVLDSLSDEKQEELNSLLDGKETESINKFFINNDINLEKIMFEESMLYKAELVGLTKETASSEA